MASSLHDKQAEKPNKDTGQASSADGAHARQQSAKGSAHRVPADAQGRRGRVFEQDDQGRTVLFYAAERGDLDRVHRIIFGLTGTGLWPQRLALIEIKDVSGLTAADVAEQAGHQEIADLLRREQVRMEYYG